VLSCVGRGLCDGLITHPEESYRVSVCVWSRNPEKGGQRSILDYKRLWMNEWTPVCFIKLSMDNRKSFHVIHSNSFAELAVTTNWYIYNSTSTYSHGHSEHIISFRGNYRSSLLHTLLSTIVIGLCTVVLQTRTRYEYRGTKTVFVIHFTEISKALGVVRRVAMRHFNELSESLQ
jgi:hypothetical protein